MLINSRVKNDTVRLEAFQESFQSTTRLTGDLFFKEVVRGICYALQVDGAWIAEYHREQHSLTTNALWHAGRYITNFSYLVDRTPWEEMIESTELVHYADGVIDRFPRGNKVLLKFNGESLSGMALHNTRGEVIGTITVIHSKAAVSYEDVATIFHMVKGRVEAELQRLKREQEILNREFQLRSLINGVQDLLISLNEKGFIMMANAAAISSLQMDESNLNRYHISRFLAESSKGRLVELIDELRLQNKEGKFVWVPDSLEIVPETGDGFKVEGTLSRYDLDDKVYYTLVLRKAEENSNISEERKQLIDQTVYVREEVEDIKQSDKLIGESPAVKRLLQNIYMVAHTDATVLIAGETGTGKELVARHIHATSNRRDKPMISVNCGAIPLNLMESEFFGHVKGSFTGATSERKGRFQLADGGTIFLDEIGELPLDLQVKLLRVIQENEFEPVGSSKTIKVNVRIIAATHRNLFELTRENKFREDLFYRLNVFPIDVPPLRQRDSDVVLLASNFVEKISRRVNKKLNPLTDAQKQMLRSYSWPGNIRELQNIIERSVILAQNGHIDLHATLGMGSVVKENPVSPEDDDRILTKDELLEFEKKNILKALKAANWKVSGRDGAAALLQMVPSTLSSRMTALAIKIPVNGK